MREHCDPTGPVEAYRTTRAATNWHERCGRFVFRSGLQVASHVSPSPLHLASNQLILNHHKIIPFTANPLLCGQKQETLISGSKVRVLVRPPIKPLKFQHEILERGSSSVRSEVKGSKGVPTFARVARERARRGECTRLTLGSPGLSEAGE